jgi:tRNA 5-methylaminomethyl-2-thiouridine biosynthesis bifunctional protein
MSAQKIAQMLALDLPKRLPRRQRANCRDCWRRNRLRASPILRGWLCPQQLTAELWRWRQHGVARYKVKVTTLTADHDGWLLNEQRVMRWWCWQTAIT